VKYTRRDFMATSAIAIGSSALAGVGRVFAAQGTEAVFRHGVASGDPLRDRVVLWTRVTPGRPGDVTCVCERVGADVGGP
jgi:alkaline phosphatase D